METSVESIKPTDHALYRHVLEEMFTGDRYIAKVYIMNDQNRTQVYIIDLLSVERLYKRVSSGSGHRVLHYFLRPVIEFYSTAETFDEIKQETLTQLSGYDPKWPEAQLTEGRLCVEPKCVKELPRDHEFEYDVVIDSSKLQQEYPASDRELSHQPRDLDELRPVQDMSDTAN